MKPKVKLDFSDFWRGFDKKDNFFYNLLSQRYDVEISSQPDYLIYSYFGKDYHKYDCIRIYYTGENIRPDFNECDYSFSFDFIENSERNYRLPLYALYADVNLLTRGKDIEKIVAEKTQFCNLVVSNPNAKKRIDFFHKLSKYKKVDSGGRILNNIGGPIQNKLEFIKDYKFTIAFENSSYPGYTTEKIFEPMLVHSLPIYWGNPLVYKDFNTKSFINYHDYENEDEVIQRIIEIDTDINLYKEYLAQPYFTGNVINQYVDNAKILKQFEYIFSNPANAMPVAKTWRRHFTYCKDVKTAMAKVKNKLARFV